MIGDGKIAGIAQRRNSAGFLFQAYVALDTPSQDILSIVSKKRGLEWMVQTKTTSINQRRLRKFLRVEIEKAIQHGFEEILSLGLVEEKLIPKEVEIAQQLAKTKYYTEDWNFRRK